MYEKSVFISHTAADEAWTRELAKALADYSVDVYPDDNIITAGEDWAEKMEQALGRSGYVSVVFTPSASRSNWVAAEIGAALAMRKELIPIVAADVPPEQIPAPIRNRQWIRKRKPEEVAAEIAHRIQQADRAA